MTGAPLPIARTISRVLIKDTDRPHPTIGLLFMQFGQFLTHDVSHSASIKTRMSFQIFHFVHFYLYIPWGIHIGDGAAIRCCTKDGRRVLPREALHFACMPIVIENDDEFYGQFGQGCMNFVRSALAPDGQCKLSYGKQVQRDQKKERRRVRERNI